MSRMIATSQDYQRGYDDGLQEGERRGGEKGKEAAAGKAEHYQDWVQDSDGLGANWRAHNIIAAAIRKLKKP